ncbi:30S ribosomal protein S7 [bacterium]|nr:30S ribosomal protein S7 [bacterium]
MSRRRVAIKKKIAPDPKYNSKLAAKFINSVMLKGKKSLAQRIFYECLDIVEKKVPDKDVMEVLSQGVGNVRPLLEVKSRRIGGATYQVPIEVRPERRTSLALRWMIQFARARKGVPMARALAMELLDAYNREGSAVKKRENMHRMAEANKAFAHYRW